MKKRLLLFLLALLALNVFTACEEESSQGAELSNEAESSVLTSEAEIGYESAELSAELFQFSLKIDGVAYKLPAFQSAFEAKGWSVSKQSAEKVKASYKADAVLSNGDTSFDIQVINPTKAELSFKECPIGRISYDFSGKAEIYIADEFLLNGTTKKAITEKYGEPETTEKHSDFSEITYGSRKTSGNYAKYLFRFDKSGNLIYFSIVNHYMPK